MTISAEPDTPTNGTTGDGRLPGQAPAYPGSFYVGLTTYAFGSQGVPFVGTAYAIEVS